MRCYLGSRVLLGLWSVPLYSDFGRVLVCKVVDGGSLDLLPPSSSFFFSFSFFWLNNRMVMGVKYE